MVTGHYPGKIVTFTVFLRVTSTFGGIYLFPVCFLRLLSEERVKSEDEYLSYLREQIFIDFIFLISFLAIGIHSIRLDIQVSLKGT